MFNEQVRRVMASTPPLMEDPSCGVGDAARRMAAHRAGVLLVVDRGILVGIFTERDALFRIVAAGLDPRTTRLAEVMTPDPVTIEPERSYGHALQLMQAHGFRHLPVVEGGKLLGIVSTRSVMDPEMEEFVSEVQRRKGFL